MTETPILSRLSPGAVVRARELRGVRAELVALPDRQQLVHLHFRRFAGCPVCDLHLHSIAVRHRELVAAGIREIAVFHSAAEELRAHGAGDLPFAVVADPAKQLYAELGVEAGLRALLHPRVYWPMLRAVARLVWAILRGRASPPALRQRHGRFGLPADFLIASDGRIVACKYGEHANDQWSVDEILQHASVHARAGDRLGELQGAGSTG